MCVQEQNRANEKPDGAADFAMPDCCGPMTARKTGADKEEKASTGGSVCEEMMNKMRDGKNPTEYCPMSAMVKKTSGKRGFWLLAMIPGLLLVLVGVAIVLEPQILVFLLAATSIVAGLMLLAAAIFFRKLTAGFRTSEG